jgi:AcrR family transcriptional regulator
VAEKGRKRGEHRTTEDSRRRILDSALELAQEKGLAGTTMALLSKRSGMPAGSLYWHFEGKDNLFAALLDRGIKERSEGVGWWEYDATETIRDHLTRFVEVRTNTLTPSGGIWRIGMILALEKSLDSPEARETFFRIRRWLEERISSWWAQVLGEATVTAEPGLPRRLTTFMMATIDGFVISENAAEDWDMEDLGQTLVEVLATMAETAMAKAGVDVTPAS